MGLLTVTLNKTISTQNAEWDKSMDYWRWTIAGK